MFQSAEEYGLATHERRVVFFDLDGTLHQQDMFGSFLRYLLRRQPLNALLVLPLLPIIAIALLIKGRAARWPMSLLLWGCTFGHNEARLQALQADFVRWFRDNVTAFPLVQERLTTYLLSSDADIWLITGSPQPLVEAVYFDTPWLPRVNLIASQIQRGYGGWVLTMRCLGHGLEKVAQLERKIGTPLRLYSGYSDSNQDNPLLYFCQHRWRVTPRGELQQLE
ncbi:phosphatidylglycerophosphatase C [Escherichia coli]|uniref:Phosphatidylglycerophosphatase C n=1 Tax=Escherichia coli TaxID=562 RepID=A0A8S0FPP4_ECOLX|nr:phosphatidylglycerophosphatase C [Escherichia coli]